MASLLDWVRSAFSSPAPEPATAPAPVRFDGWENAYTGFGTSRDKMAMGYYVPSVRLTDPELSGLYYSEDIAAKIVDKRPEEAFRRGYSIEGEKDLEDLARTLGVDEKLQEAWTWGRLFGGALLVIGTEGGGTMEKPLVEASVRRVAFLNVVDRRYAHVESYYGNPLKPSYGMPEVYRIYGMDGKSSLVHESRCLRFDGVIVDVQKRAELAGWSLSVLQRPYDEIRRFAAVFQACGVLTSDASQGVFKMKGLFDMIASGEKGRLQERMRLVDMSRSAARSILLDSDGEDFTRVATSFAGLPEMIDRFCQRLAASIDMPVTLLMGRSPAGMNATGDSDFQHWYGTIAAEQKKSLTPQLQKLYRILSAGRVKEAEICWRPMKETSEADRLDADKKRAETDKIYIEAGVLFPEEVALARFSDATDGEIEIDTKAREESLAAEIELALNPPPPPPAVPPGSPPVPPAPGEAPAPPPVDEPAEPDASA